MRRVYEGIMQRAGFPLACDVAASRWQFRSSPRQAPLDIDDFELLHWVRSQSADPQVLRAAQFCRRYEHTWMSAELAAKRVMCERGEVLGARIGGALASLCVPAALLLWFGGSTVQAAGLAIALAIAGALTLVWKGALVVPRVAVLQTIAVATLAIGKLGFLAGLVTAIYVPALAMAAAAVVGARAGRALADLSHARLVPRLAVAVESQPRRPEDAVAA